MQKRNENIMLRSCPCCKRKISDTAKTCPWCGCDIQNELYQQATFLIWAIKWFAIPFIIFVFFCALLGGEKASGWIWIIAQIGWIIFLKSDVLEKYLTNDENSEKQNSEILEEIQDDAGNTEVKDTVHSTSPASSKNHNSAAKSKKQRGRKIEI